MCVTNYTETEITRDQWKIEVGGRSFSSVLSGFEKLSIMNSIEIPIPIVVAW